MHVVDVICRPPNPRPPASATVALVLGFVSADVSGLPVGFENVLVVTVADVAGAGVPNEDVTVVGVRAGSVIVEVDVHFQSPQLATSFLQAMLCCTRDHFRCAVPFCRKPGPITRQARLGAGSGVGSASLPCICSLHGPWGSHESLIVRYKCISLGSRVYVISSILRRDESNALRPLQSTNSIMS